MPDPNMVEITEEEARVLRGSRELMDKLLKNPKTRAAQEKLIKELHPEAITTEDQLSPYMSEIKALRDDLKEIKKARDDEKLDAKFHAQIAQLKEDGYTDEGIEKIKKIMVDEQIPNAIAAAAFWEKQNPKAPVPQSLLSGTDWGWGRKTGEDKEIDLLFNSPDEWAEREAQKAWAEEVAKKGQIIT